MSSNRSKSFKRLGIIAGIILLALFLGYITGNIDTVTDILSALGLILIAISILVTVHELGHFLTAKAFGMRVETFSIGFPPKLFSFTKGETEYQIGATPLGGYVKISGIIDESFDTEYLGSEPKPYEFRSKPVWQRLIVMTGGVIMNILLGIFIFSMLKYTYGDQFLPSSEVKYGIDILEGKESVGSKIGFHKGDTILNFKGEEKKYFDEYLDPANVISDGAYYEVMRNGEVVRLDVPGDIQNFFNDKKIARTMFAPRWPSIVSVSDSLEIELGKPKFASPAFQGGLQTGDRIIQLDSTSIVLFDDIITYMKGRTHTQIAVKVERGSETLDFDIDIGDKPYLGLTVVEFEDAFKLDTLTYGFFESFSEGTDIAFKRLFDNVQGFKNLSRPGVEVSKSIIGPIQIAKSYLEIWRVQGIEGFIRITGMLSMVLALINILPIPALDGGHVVFLLIEAVTRKEPSVKVRLIAQQIGMILVLMLMAYFLLNDIIQI